MKILPIVAVASLLSGCAGLGVNSDLSFGSTYAETKAGFSYVPIEPTLVNLLCDSSTSARPSANLLLRCPRNLPKNELLNGLPDNSVRIATRRIGGKASGSIGALGLSTGTEGSSYEVIIDFVNTQTVNLQFEGYWKGFSRRPDGSLGEEFAEVPMLDFPENDNKTQWKLIIKKVLPQSIEEEESFSRKDVSDVSENLFNIPVYIGLGLRLRANVTVLEGNVDLSSLASIAAAVEAERASGTMSVQTIGVTGKTPRGSLLLLDKIDDTTIQNSIQTLASIKASIENDDTTITPRVVGFHNTIGTDANGVNLIHSFLAQQPLPLILNQSAHVSGNGQ